MYNVDSLADLQAQHPSRLPDPFTFLCKACTSTGINVVGSNKHPVMILKRACSASALAGSRGTSTLAGWKCFHLPRSLQRKTSFSRSALIRSLVSARVPFPPPGSTCVLSIMQTSSGNDNKCDFNNHGVHLSRGHSDDSDDSMQLFSPAGPGAHTATQSTSSTSKYSASPLPHPVHAEAVIWSTRTASVFPTRQQTLLSKSCVPPLGFGF